MWGELISSLIQAVVSSAANQGFQSLFSGGGNQGGGGSAPSAPAAPMGTPGVAGAGAVKKSSALNFSGGFTGTGPTGAVGTQGPKPPMGGGSDPSGGFKTKQSGFESV